LSDKLDGKKISTIQVERNGKFVVAGTSNGSVAVVESGYQAAFDENDVRTIKANPKLLGIWDLEAGLPVSSASYYDAEGRKMIVALHSDNDEQRLIAVILKQKRSLFGGGKIVVDRREDLTQLIDGKIDQVLIGADAEVIIATTSAGDVHYLRVGEEETVTAQQFQPFPNQNIALINFLLADKTLVIGNESGEMVGYTLLTPTADSGLQFVPTKQFGDLPEAPQQLVPSRRNRSFLITTETHVSLCYGTTASTRWKSQLPFSPVAATLSSKSDTILFADDAGGLHFYSLNDKHPEAGWAAFFGKIWYEGAPRPDWIWQSTGGSDSFEPKLSMRPLIFGSIKGTVYAILFALPLALLAAIYCSQFQNYRYKALVKPTMEIMASLPSVVLGFLGALWLAPLLEDQVPAVLSFLLILPALAMGFGYAWTRLPASYRVICKPGREFIFALPIVAASFFLAKYSGPVLESILFTVSGPEGKQVADFRLWWNETTGSNFEQRNALIVGFMMGFAVIPIIFTITEDALSNVPQDLRSASLALGASRWQTAMRVVLPTASPGIFSAVMIGIGRAVGETMIVLMATGNTPIMEWSVFNGMRTLAANIAVELPEAPVGGTLYRSLYMGALILFCMTFVLNTCAELLRRHLRNKYKTV
jgi:phosphate transport system permease protein